MSVAANNVNRVHRFTAQQRRDRIGTRHLLATAASTPIDAANGVVALHATDPATVFLSIRARMADATVEAVEDALYRQRCLIRMLGMRRTMFVVPVDLAPSVQAGATGAVAVRLRRTYGKFLADGGVGDGEWLDAIGDDTVAALALRGEATAAQLSTDVPRLRSTVLLNEGKAYGGQQTVTTWVLSLLAAEGRIVRGRPRGSWTSSQWSWSPMDAWLPGGLTGLPVAEAQVDVARRWLHAFGPATVTDLRWWTGWTATEARRALTAIEPVEVDLDGEPGIALRDDLEPESEPKPWVALLPALDATAMGWTHRSFYLGDHEKPLFDATGNIGPTIWSNGRIIGGWTQRTHGEIAHRLLEDVDAEIADAVAAEAARLTTWLGPARVGVRGRRRTPLEQELVT